MIKLSTLYIIYLIMVVFILSTDNLKAQTYRILPLGNSITEGSNLVNPPVSKRASYRDQLYDNLIWGGYDFDFVGHAYNGWDLLPDADHGGIPGTRGSYMVRLLQDGYDMKWHEQITSGQKSYLDEYPADIILLHIGTNDIIPSGSYAGAVNDILDEIDAWQEKTGAHITVFLAKIINSYPYNATITAYNQNLSDLVTGRGDPHVILVDMENGAGINYSMEMMEDGLHPLPSAYNKMGDTWYLALHGYLTAIPDTPGDFAIEVVNDNSAELSWSDLSDNETGFEIERSTSMAGGSFTLIHTTGKGVSSFVDKGLNENSLYYYRIRAINTTGPSLYTPVEAAATRESAPAEPSNLMATPLGASSIRLEWRDNSTDETGFIIERSEIPGTAFSTLDTTASNEVSYVDVGLLDGSECHYRVRAINGVLGSNPSNEASALTSLSPPSGLSAKAKDDKSVSLIWSDNSASETGYIIERSINFGEDYVTTIEVGSNITSYEDLDVSEGDVLFYRVRATNGITPSMPSNESGTAVHLAAPAGLVAIKVGVSGMLLVWSDNSQHESAYSIERSVSHDSSFAEIHSTQADETQFEDLGLMDGTRYYYRVKAINGEVSSAYSSPSWAITDLAAPTGMEAQSINESSISLTWKDNSESEAGFVIERSAGHSSGFEQIYITSANETAITDSGLKDGMEYFYRARAFNGLQNSTQSKVSNAYTTLAAPTSLSLLSSDESGSTLSWIDNSVNETGYIIEKSDNSHMEFAQIHVAPANSTTFFDQSEESGHRFYYRVRATNGTINSEYSNEVKTGLNEVATDTPFSFFPNPNQGHITLVINIEDNKVKYGYIKLADFSGRIHFLKELDLSKGTHISIHEIDLPSTMTGGFYSLSVMVGDQSSSEKFLLLK